MFIDRGLEHAATGDPRGDPGDAQSGRVSLPVTYAHFRPRRSRDVSLRTRSVGVGTSVLVFQDLIHCFLDATHLPLNTANADDAYKDHSFHDAITPFKFQ